MKKNENYIPKSQKRDLRPLNFPECIYLSENCKCSLLQVNDCLGSKCSFCITKNELKKSKNKWHRHMNSLSEEKQKKIANYYYGGNMPWKE